LIEAIATGDGTDPRFDPLYEDAIRDTIERFEATGSPVITDGEQRKYHNFWTYCVQGLPNTAPDGFKIPFSAGHIRRMPRLTAGPFRYRRYADSYLDVARRYAHVPVKQAVISPSALSLLYPADEITGYPREQFIQDLLGEHETEVRRCLQKGAHKVQIDFTEGRLAVKIDPSGDLLHRFIDLNNLALSRFSADDRRRIGVHTCPGSDRDSTHSGDVDYAELLPSLFQLKVGSFYIALAGERGHVRILKIVRQHMKTDQRVFIGVVSPIDPRIDTAEEVRDRVLEAAEYIPVEQMGRDRRLRILALLGRHVDQPRHGLREDSRARPRHQTCGGTDWRRVMAPDEDEEELLRSVALQNAQSILLARQRAEEELVQAKEALELRTGELARSLAIMRATLESTTDGILVTGGIGQVTGFNQKYLELWRLPHELMDAGVHGQVLDACGRQLNDPRQYLARIDEIYASSPSESYDLLELADGRVFERFSRIQVVDGTTVGRVWSFRDITERRLAEEALQKQSEWLRVTLSSIGDAVITTDAEGRVTFQNGVAESLTGWSTDDAAGRPLPYVFQIVNEQTREPVENPALRALRAGTVVGLPNHTVLISRDGTERPIDDSAAPMRDGSGKMLGAVLVFHDITERKRAEDERSEVDRKKDEFLALLAHELRNPLAPLRNGLQVMRLAGDDTNAVTQARAMMDRQLGHMVRLIDDLLDVSRIGRHKMELRRGRIALADVIDNAVETARPLLEAARHELSVSLPREPVFLDADLTRLAQVFSNLLTNSAKYTPREGHIWLTAERRGDEVVASVRDTGIGIPAEELPRVFDMFSQVDRSIERSTGGLGLGLALVKGLVEMHGGSVTAESDGPGEGSTFTVRLPASRAIDDGSAPSAPPEENRLSAIPKRRILVVDDNQDAARTMDRLLKLLGHEVHMAYDGIEAVRAAEKLGPEIILMDVGMPRLNGYQAARRIREQPWGRDVVIIALTGWGQEGDRLQSREAGCDGHLVKPVNFPDLDRLLAELTQNVRPPQAPARGGALT